MRVKIGPYVNWIGPYQIAEKILFWKDKEEDRSVHNFGKWLAGGKNHKSWLYSFCEWVHEKKKRKVIIKLDRYDSWNAEHTLALIIHPLLVKLKAEKHGAPHTDPSDTPDSLKPENDPKWMALPEDERKWTTDEFFFDRWDWIMTEIIWSFEQLITEDADEQFYSGESDHFWQAMDADGNDIGQPKRLGEDLPPDIEAKVSTYRLIDGPNHTFKIDSKGLDLYNARVANGTRLFGKYYRNLWD